MQDMILAPFGALLYVTVQSLMVLMSVHYGRWHCLHTCHDPVSHRDGEADPAAEVLWVVCLLLPHGCLILRVPAAQHDQLRAASPYPSRVPDRHPFPNFLISTNHSIMVGLT